MGLTMASLIMSFKSIFQGKPEKSYKKLGITDSQRIAEESKLAQKLVKETLKLADSPGRKTFTR
eukprot:c18177_g1_i2 orf=257-448(+)